jgi:hypothetical protein
MVTIIRSENRYCILIGPEPKKTNLLVFNQHSMEITKLISLSQGSGELDRILLKNSTMRRPIDFRDTASSSSPPQAIYYLHRDSSRFPTYIRRKTQPVVFPAMNVFPESRKTERQMGRK